MHFGYGRDMVRIPTCTLRARTELKTGNLIRPNDAEIRLFSYRQQINDHPNRWRTEEDVMLYKMTLALALVIAALAAVQSSVAPRDGGQTAFHDTASRGLASAGGNLVPVF